MSRYFAVAALLPHGWASDVVIEVGEDGTIVSVVPSAPAGPAQRLAGWVVPGMPNVHSHAFQRAFAGRAERADPARDDTFWTWREQMYGLVARIEPDQAEAIAAWVYVEMLKGGYTAVGEFHYLHHDRAGAPYGARTEMADRIRAAAQTSGIGLTLLPVLYAHAGFGGVAATGRQCRFLNTVETFVADWDVLAAAFNDDPQMRLGVAPHSLRAVTPRELDEVVRHVTAADRQTPVHIHIAEQQAEVDACIAWCGERPIAWLLGHTDVSAAWCLVHATHADATELAAIARREAVVGLCPTTEANLGDGIFPAERFRQAGGRFGVGSDSNVTLDVAEELRWLEYGQRLTSQRRAVLGDEGTPHVGARLYRDALAGGAQSLARPIGAIAAGMRADIVVVDPGRDPAMEGAAGDDLLDRLRLCVGRASVARTSSSGRWQSASGVHDGHHGAGCPGYRGIDLAPLSRDAAHVVRLRRFSYTDRRDCSAPRAHLRPGRQRGHPGLRVEPPSRRPAR